MFWTLAVQEFIRGANWLLDVLRQHRPLTEAEARAVDVKIRAMLLEWDTWKKWNDEQKKLKKSELGTEPS